MQLEVGKFYRTRGGWKAGVVGDDGSRYLPLRVQHDAHNWHKWHNIDGTLSDDVSSDFDIIAEWTDEPEQTGPVRDVLRKKIAHGIYGKLSVHQLRGDNGEVYMAFVDSISHKENTVHAVLTAAELRAAAATMIEIADAMKGGAK